MNIPKIPEKNRLRNKKSARECVLKQPACKPGSVIGSHLSGTDIAARLEPPVWRLVEQTVAPKSVLLRIEFTGCPGHPEHRWALTPPFHLFPVGGRGSLFLLHLSGGRPRPMLSVILLCEARTFLTGNPPARLPGSLRSLLYRQRRKKSRFPRSVIILKGIFKNFFSRKGIAFLHRT